jgi:hypothetical protein
MPQEQQYINKRIQIRIWKGFLTSNPLNLLKKKIYVDAESIA